MAHDPSRIGSEQIILHGRSVRSDDDEIGPSFLGNPQNLGIDARTMSDEDAGIEVGGIDPADQGGNPVF